MSSITPTIISIDVGIRNLSFCMMTMTSPDSPKILKWDVLDISNAVVAAAPTCSESGCSKKAKYLVGAATTICATHARKPTYLKPEDVKPFTKTALSKMNVADMTSIAHRFVGTPPLNKKELIAYIRNIIDQRALKPIPKNKKCTQISLIDIAKNMNARFNAIFVDAPATAATVYIENQMTSRMKNISYIIAEYFLVKGYSAVNMVSPSNKLKYLESETTTYGDRKKNSVKHTLAILEKSGQTEWLELLKKHKKKDDLCDSFLQGIYGGGATTTEFV